METAALQSIESLERWFKSGNRPRWNLYRGHLSSKKTSYQVARNDSEDDMEEAFQMLKESISMQSGGGGRFTVFVCTSDTPNSGLTTFLTIFGPSNNMGTPGVHGFHAMNATGPGIYGTELLEREVSKARDTERRQTNLEWEIKNLRRELKEERDRDPNPDIGFIGKVGNLMFEDPEEFGKLMTTATNSFAMLIQACMATMQVVNGQPGQQASVSGSHPIPPGTPTSQSSQPNQPSQAGQPSHQNQKVLSQEASTAILELGAQYDLNKVMPQIAKIAAEQPELFQRVIQQEV